MIRNILVSSFALLLVLHCVLCNLYPKDSETRNSINLDGLWEFTLNENDNIFHGFQKAGVAADNIQLMPVPASYNEITPEWTLRDHVGKVYYQKKFFVPSTWQGQKVWIRFGSVCYSGNVFINGEYVVYHEIGHLPFIGDVTNIVQYGQENVLVIEVDNTLTDITIPQGEVETLSNGRLKQTYSFDFFNFAGIDRPVLLYTTPNVFIDDITVVTDISDDLGTVTYEVAINGSGTGLQIEVHLFDKENNLVVSAIGPINSLIIENAHFWWPYQMSNDPAYLYTLQVELLDEEENLLDIYRLPVGIRNVKWTNTKLLINDRPVYFRGFNKHEDSDIRGKGLDLPLTLRDYNLFKWIGGNVFRTSHYPYADEIMDLADQIGILVIDECPAVDTDGFVEEALLENHKRAINEMIKRDKNRPSVIMWSVSNEPSTQNSASEAYFREIFEYARTLDTSRPYTIIQFQDASVDHASQFADIIGYNIYDGWYQDVADLDAILPNILERISAFNVLHNKPVFVSEYGAETIVGYRSLPKFIFSEEFQISFLSTYFQAFDQLRTEQDWFLGELIWNFADFRTSEGIQRVGGNRKGIFTRNREPKSSAYLIRERYWKLAQKLDNSTVPGDLRPYILPHDEL